MGLAELLGGVRPSRAAVAVESTKSVNMNVAVTDEDTDLLRIQPPMRSLSCHQREALIPSVDLCFAGAVAVHWGDLASLSGPDVRCPTTPVWGAVDQIGSTPIGACSELRP